MKADVEKGSKEEEEEEHCKDCLDFTLLVAQTLIIGIFLVLFVSLLLRDNK